MAFTAEQLQVVTQVVQTGLHQYMENMKPMFEQLVVASTQGQGGQSRKFAESLSKHTDVFKNSGFDGWQPKMLTAARAISQKAHDVMEYPKSILDTEVPDDAFTFDLEKKNLNQQLYYVLTEKTEGEAFDLVRGVPLQNGAEAWRRLLVRFDARTIGKEMLLGRRVVNPPKIKNHRDTAAQIEKWQECRGKLEQEYGCKVESGLQKAILIEMLTATLMEGVMALLDASQTFDGKHV